ncbi:MAG: hypothetical protein D0433_02125 [Candidatus Thermochlorobacter aerophilum]|uniref:Uncharacterized protein n=1 Tax=Candidatus Thermochlorobacter aerophilus TaxID=1868324 RepID=A0A395M362_9BACT|nr:MAG: hypothetical protein D0433_02125 [Candidatus Thermochlorobacter aerophilum]
MLKVFLKNSPENKALHAFSRMKKSREIDARKLVGDVLFLFHLLYLQIDFIKRVSGITATVSQCLKILITVPLVFCYEKSSS